MSGIESYKSVPFCLLLFAILLVQATVADDAEHYECLNKLGGLDNIMEKTLVNKDDYNPETEIQISKIPKPFRINRPTIPLKTDDYNPDRITLTADLDGIITDAECI